MASSWLTTPTAVMGKLLMLKRMSCYQRSTSLKYVDLDAEIDPLFNFSEAVKVPINLEQSAFYGAMENSSSYHQLTTGTSTHGSKPCLMILSFSQRDLSITKSMAESEDTTDIC